MKKKTKVLMLGAIVLLSTQGIINETESVSANEKTMTSITEKRSLPKVSVSLGELSKKHSGSPFKDTSTSIFKNYITWIYDYGITTGYTPTSYKPNNNVTRGEMAVFLWRLAGSPHYTAPFNIFSDVNQYKTQILWLSATTVTRGTGSHYDPNGKVTRGQMAAFLHRLAVVSGKASASEKYNPYFKDAKKHMFANDIGWMKVKGITDSRNINYNPDANVTRGEMAAFLQRFYNAMNLKVNKTSLKVKDISLSVGDPWKPADNFVSATDNNGKVIDLNKVEVRGGADTSKPGTYIITYHYGGKSVQAKVTVIDKSSIKLKATTLSEGLGYDKVEEELRANIIGLVNPSGQDVLLTDRDKVKITAQKDNGGSVDLEDLSKTEGTYTILYNYSGKTSQLVLSISSAIPVLSTDGKLVQFKNQSWSVFRTLGNNNYLVGSMDLLGKSLFLNNSTRSTPYYSSNEPEDVGSYNNSLVKETIDSWYNTNIKGQPAEKYVMPVDFPDITLKDMKDLNVLIDNRTDDQMLTSNYFEIGNSKYRTEVNESGKKQAFAPSVADLSTGQRSPVINSLPDITPEVQEFISNFGESHNMFSIALRSPGISYNSSAILTGLNRTGYIDSSYLDIKQDISPFLVLHVE